MPTSIRGLCIRWEALPRLRACGRNVVWIIGFVVGIGIRRGLMLPLPHANQGEILPMRPEVRPQRPINEDHVALRQCDWSLIEGDLGSLWGHGERDADRVQ